MLSIIIPTYNRAHCLSRAIESVLAQDYAGWEMIVVDDGSTDGTAEVLARYADPRIRVIRHPANRGVGTAKNTGLDNVRGRWFAILDSDDEITPGALSELLGIAAGDPSLTAITCNCIDSVSGALTGSGFDRDQHLAPGQIFKDGRGEFWGITRTELLGASRLNEHVVSWESVLWFQVEKRARRYYLHKALRIYHTESCDSISKTGNTAGDREREYRNHMGLLNEKEFLADLRRWRPDQYIGILFTAGLLAIERGRRSVALRCAARLLLCSGGRMNGLAVLFGTVFGAAPLMAAKRLKLFLRRATA